MGFAQDLRTLYHLTLAPVRGATHQARLEGFYSRQASNYDSFRERLLPGRHQIYSRLNIPKGGVWVEMGGGTGSNLEILGDQIHELKKIYIVDLSASLLKIADERIKKKNWTNVETVLGDVTTFRPEFPADLVCFSYSLTMIPDWFKAIDHAFEILSEGGTLAVVDFFTQRKFQSVKNQTSYSWWNRTFWPIWFGMDNVNLSADHLPYLQNKFEEVHCVEDRAKVPYLSVLGRVPYYQFVGMKAGKSIHKMTSTARAV